MRQVVSWKERRSWDKPAPGLVQPLTVQTRASHRPAAPAAEAGVHRLPGAPRFCCVDGAQGSEACFWGGGELSTLIVPAVTALWVKLSGPRVCRAHPAPWHRFCVNLDSRTSDSVPQCPTPFTKCRLFTPARLPIQSNSQELVGVRSFGMDHLWTWTCPKREGKVTLWSKEQTCSLSLGGQSTFRGRWILFKIPHELKMPCWKFQDMRTMKETAQPS